jgi:glycine cleavage system H lipoate-binding protein
MTVLFVVATILAFLGIDWMVQRSRAKDATRSAAPARSAEAQPFPLRVPEGIFFAKSHTWLSLFPSGKVRLGIDDFIANLLEQAEVTLIKTQGERVEKGEPLLVIAENGQALTVRTPISGVVVSTNPKLEERRGLKHADLFSDGWAYTIRPTKPEELRGLLIGNETRSWMSSELGRLRDFFAGAIANGVLAPAALQDGGAPAPGALLHLGPEVWRRFEQQFLQSE